jgi:WhiB family transcriptional regulator, redox-sensing transcriptional regulator
VTARVLAWTPQAPDTFPAEDISWRDGAECQYTDPEIFFPELGANVAPVKQICRGCPARLQCYEFAVSNDMVHGVWAGLSERELRVARQDPRPAAEILADADARYDARSAAVIARRNRRFAAERARRAAKTEAVAA